MPEPVNIVDIVNELPKRRACRACIVLTRDAGEQKAWSAKLAERTDSKHIDLLDRFAEDPELGKRLQTFGVDDLFKLLEAEDAGKVIVTGIDFLRAAWSGNASTVMEFAKRSEFWSKKPAMLFVTQYDRQLAKLNVSDRYGYTYVIDQKETLAL
jgi:hypothetical protein